MNADINIKDIRKLGLALTALAVTSLLFLTSQSINTNAHSPLGGKWANGSTVRW